MLLTGHTVKQYCNRLGEYQRNAGNSNDYTDNKLPDDKRLNSAENVKPVFLKGLFSVSTTSTKSVQAIRADIIRVLRQLGVDHKEIRGGFSCRHTPALLNGFRTDDLEFEIFIVKVPLLSMHGIQFKRVAGSSWEYKVMADQILRELPF